MILEKCFGDEVVGNNIKILNGEHEQFLMKIVHKPIIVQEKYLSIATLLCMK